MFPRAMQSACSRHFIALPRYLVLSHKISSYQLRFLSQEISSVIDATKLRKLENVCWKCRKVLDKNSKFFCSTCGSVLPIISLDHFALFDLKKDFKIHLPELQKKFKSLQKQLHPDKFSLKGRLEVDLSETISSELNKAYFALLKPLSRGLYMLEQQGISLGEDVNSDDPELLMEIMEINEKISDITSDDELRVIYDDIMTQVESLTNEISDAFQRDAFDVAKLLLIKFKYFDNILEKLKERLLPL